MQFGYNQFSIFDIVLIVLKSFSAAVEFHAVQSGVVVSTLGSLHSCSNPTKQLPRLTVSVSYPLPPRSFVAGAVSRAVAATIQPHCISTCVISRSLAIRKSEIKRVESRRTSPTSAPRAPGSNSAANSPTSAADQTDTVQGCVVSATLIRFHLLFERSCKTAIGTETPASPA